MSSTPTSHPPLRGPRVNSGVRVPMKRHTASEQLAPSVRSALRYRLLLRRTLVVSVFVYVAIIVVDFAVPEARHNSILALAVFAWICAFVLSLVLLFGACPRCKNRFSPKKCGKSVLLSLAIVLRRRVRFLWRCSVEGTLTMCPSRPLGDAPMFIDVLSRSGGLTRRYADMHECRR